MPGWDARKLSPEMWRSRDRPGWGWEWQKGTSVGAPEKQNKTHSSGAVSTQVHSRTRASWWLLAGRSRDHLSQGSERWPRSGPPLHPRAQMTSATEPQGWDGARCPAARAQCTGLRALPHRRGPGLGAASSQAPRDWDHRTRPSSQPRWRKSPERREGARACCFPPAGRAGRRGGARAPEAITGAGWSISVREPLAEGLGAPGAAPAHAELRASPAEISGAMAGLRVLLCLGALLAHRGSAEPGAVVIGEIHEDVTLRCGNVSGSRGPVTWYRNDSQPIFLLSSNSSLPAASPRFSLEDAGALHIESLSLEDDGSYTCQEDLNETRWFPVWLRVASGPTRVDINISATGTLPNGTLYAAKGSQVDFGCRSSAWPPPEVEWWLQAHSKPESFGRNLSANSFALLLMSQNLQGNYTCSATNVLSGRQRKVTTELLVYWPPSSAPQCSVEVSSLESATLELTCNWDGGYPDPTFLWTEEPRGMIMGNSRQQMLSPSQLSEGKKFKCVGSHIVGPESGASCVVQISSPLLSSQPMKTCFLGGNVTLTCQVTGANPPARIQWLRNLTQPEVTIQPGSRYVITQLGQSSSLTIYNCSQDSDGGFYFCRAENPVGVKAVDIWLSVKEPLNIGGIVGTVVSLLLLGLAIVSGLTLYYSPVFCWKAGSTFRGQDMGDVMVLVDSEEEEEVEEEGDKEDVAEEVEQETSEREEMPKEISKHGHIHRVTALVNGNLNLMGNGLQELQDDSDEQQSDIVQEEDKPL